MNGEEVFRGDIEYNLLDRESGRFAGLKNGDTGQWLRRMRDESDRPQSAARHAWLYAGEHRRGSVVLGMLTS